MWLLCIGGCEMSGRVADVHDLDAAYRAYEEYAEATGVELVACPDMDDCAGPCDVCGDPCEACCYCPGEYGPTDWTLITC